MPTNTDYTAEGQLDSTEPIPTMLERFCCKAFLLVMAALTLAWLFVLGYGLTLIF